MIERRQAHAAVTAFLALFSIVGIALYGLPFFYDFFVRDLGWTRAQVTSGNALSKVVVGPLFGFAAGWIVDRFGPRRLMLAGIVMAGAALVGLGSVTTLGFFYACYMLNALGNVCGGPLPNQVLLARWFDRNRGKAMGFAYLGIGIGGTLVPLIATALITEFGWRTALRVLGVLMVAIAFPAAWFVKDSPEGGNLGTVPRDLGTVPRAFTGGQSPTDGGQSPLSSDASLAGVLPAAGGLDVLDCGRRRDGAEPEAVSQHRPEAVAVPKSRASRRWSSSRAWRDAS